MSRPICYVGEINDHADRWLIRILRGHFTTNVITPTDLLPTLDYSLVINRLYGSAVSRHGEKVGRILKFLQNCEMSNIPVINSTFGYGLEAKRLEHYKLFSEAGLCYAPTLLAKNANLSPSKPSYVLKDSFAFRNRKLRIIRELAELSDISEEVRKRAVLQSLVEEKICYRTEFIGISHITFVQSIDITSENLTFQYTGEIIRTPLEPDVIGKLANLARSIGVQTFSVEYFLHKKHTPEIVDFNINSNYKPFLIAGAGSRMKAYWLNLISSYATITRDNIIS